MIRVCLILIAMTTAATASDRVVRASNGTTVTTNGNRTVYRSETGKVLGTAKRHARRTVYRNQSGERVAVGKNH